MCGINLFDDSGRITADDHIVRYILCDDSTSGNDGIPTDGYAWTDDGSDTDPCILFDGHLSEMKQVVTIIEIVIHRCNLNFGANQYVVLYHHLPRRENGGTFVDSDILADCHPTSAVAIEWGDDSDTIINLALEQFFQQSLRVEFYSTTILPLNKPS